MIVVDASVAAKWFLNEAGTSQAQALLVEQEKFYAPELIKLEVLGAITRQMRLGKLKAPEIQALCKDWQAHLQNRALTLLPNDKVLDQAIEFSILYKHGLADCMYLAASQLTGLPLITADRTFYERCHSEHSVKLLSTDK